MILETGEEFDESEQDYFAEEEEEELEVIGSVQEQVEAQLQRKRFCSTPQRTKTTNRTS
jgi:hypothetical protein